VFSGLTGFGPFLFKTLLKMMPMRAAPTTSKTAGPARKGPPPRMEVGARIKVIKTGLEGTVRFVGPVAVLPSGEAPVTMIRDFESSVSPVSPHPGRAFGRSLSNASAASPRVLWGAGGARWDRSLTRTIAAYQPSPLCRCSRRRRLGRGRA